MCTVQLCDRDRDEINDRRNGTEEKKKNDKFYVKICLSEHKECGDRMHTLRLIECFTDIL